MKIQLKNIRITRSFWLTLILTISVSVYSFAQENSVAVNIHDSNLEWGPCPDFIPSGCQVSILHGDPKSNNADAVFKFDSNTDIPEHWHNSAERMILIQGELEVTYEGEETQVLKAGYFAYGPEKKPHDARCTEGPCILYVAFEKPVDAFAGKPN